MKSSIDQSPKVYLLYDAAGVPRAELSDYFLGELLALCEGSWVDTPPALARLTTPSFVGRTWVAGESCKLGVGYSKLYIHKGDQIVRVK